MLYGLNSFVRATLLNAFVGNNLKIYYTLHFPIRFLMRLSDGLVMPRKEEI